MGRTDIGLELNGSCLSPLLKSGATFANFQIDGTLPDSMERLNSDVRVGATTSMASLSKRAFILSRPTALFGLSGSIALKTKSVEIGLNRNTLEVRRLVAWSIKLWVPFLILFSKLQANVYKNLLNTDTTKAGLV